MVGWMFDAFSRGKGWIRSNRGLRGEKGKREAALRMDARNQRTAGEEGFLSSSFLGELDALVGGSSGIARRPGCGTVCVLAGL